MHVNSTVQRHRIDFQNRRNVTVAAQVSNLSARYRPVFEAAADTIVRRGPVFKRIGVAWEPGR